MIDTLFILFGGDTWIYPTVISFCLILFGMIVGTAIGRETSPWKPEVE